MSQGPCRDWGPSPNRLWPDGHYRGREDIVEFHAPDGRTCVDATFAVELEHHFAAPQGIFITYTTFSNDNSESVRVRHKGDSAVNVVCPDDSSFDAHWSQVAALFTCHGLSCPCPRSVMGPRSMSCPTADLACEEEKGRWNSECDHLDAGSGCESAGGYCDCGLGRAWCSIPHEDGGSSSPGCHDETVPGCEP